MNELLFPLLIVIASGVISTVLGGIFNVGAGRSAALFVWHMVFGFVYMIYVQAYGGDALGYYALGQGNSESFGFGTDAVVLFVSLLRQIGDFSFLSVSMVFNLIGTIGLLALDGSFKTITVVGDRRTQWMARWIVFLPSVSFWSAGIGKDSIAFAAVGLALWASLLLRRRWWLMVGAIALMLVVRPHIAALMALAVMVALVFNPSVTRVQKMVLSVIALLAIASLIPLAMNYAGLGDARNAADVESYVEARQGFNQSGEGAVDITEMSLPMQLFTYVFRPLPYEASGVASLAASLENVILILFAVFALRAWWSTRRFKQTHWGQGTIAFSLMYSLLAWIILAMTTANLGISLRQKWMFMPMLLYVAFAMMVRKDRLRQLRSLLR